MRKTIGVYRTELVDLVTAKEIFLQRRNLESGIASRVWLIEAVSNTRSAKAWTDW